jgi:transcriptional regulator with XRE-family HTH domain
MSIADAIRELRRSRMLTASELAKRSRISRGHLHVENKSFMPSLRTVEKISAAMGVGVQRLLTLNSSEVVLEDSFIQEIRPFLPRLNARQRELVLRTLQAAPKNQRQRKSW